MLMPATIACANNTFMADKRIDFECNYCGATYTLKYPSSDGNTKPDFCSFCGEADNTTKASNDDEEDLSDYDIDEDD